MRYVTPPHTQRIRRLVRLPPRNHRPVWWLEVRPLAKRYESRSDYGQPSRLGYLLVDGMNRLGILVDFSHTSDATATHALKCFKAPVIWSPLSSRAVYDVPRNVPDVMCWSERWPEDAFIVYPFFFDSLYGRPTGGEVGAVRSAASRQSRSGRKARRDGRVVQVASSYMATSSSPQEKSCDTLVRRLNLEGLTERISGCDGLNGEVTCMI